MEFFRHRRAADDLAAFDHLHAQAGHREIGRAGEAVMPRADDDDVGFVHVRFNEGHSGSMRSQTRNRGPGSALRTVPNRRSSLADVHVAQRQVCSFWACIARNVAYALSCRRQLAGSAAGARRVQAGAFMSLSDPSAVTDAIPCPEPAGAGGLYRGDLRQRAAAVLGAAAVHQDGAAAARRLAGGMVGGDGVFPVAAARRLRLCAFPDEAAQPRAAGGVHLVLLVVALLTLPLSIAGGWGEPPTSGYAFWLLGLFAVSIGLPFFALAANNPLLQAWFVRTGHPNGPDPYFLYASSNIGSFLALLSYPVLLEPMFTLRTQNLIWTGGYGLLIVLIAACGVLLLRSPANAAGRHGRRRSDAPAPSWMLRARWIFLAAVPSGLLIAVTAHISTDVAAAPLLWVLPLSLYLLTWVLVFQSRPLLPHKWMLLAAAAGDRRRHCAARGRR